MYRTALAFLFLAAASLPAHAQQTPPGPASVVVRETSAPFRADTIAPVVTERVRRDHYLGGGYGLLIGGLVGGGGFAAANYAFSDASDMVGLSFLLGGVVGGASGLVIGALVGVPVRETDARVSVARAGRAGGTVVSLSVPAGW